MPPPNHQTGSSPSRVATRKRTFRCVVGQYGLRGCRTRETPIASKPRPASSGRAALAEGGSRPPDTCEKLKPPRSNSAPPPITHETPPPPPAPGPPPPPRGPPQGPGETVPPSRGSSSATIRPCGPTSQDRTAVAFIPV